ncbi:MAG: hypothetical protein JWM99_17, partial [Verrucomicrobiales bacterium]|nr:hypothetical protein [Verrucomicrobiales bacterium]
TVTAKASNLQGLEGHSEPVRIMVLDGDAGSFVKRTLPAGYLPGHVFTVRLAAQPSDGVSAYTIEEKPPQGWTVNAISNDGVFDNTTGKVKFGPYLDASPRSLSYDVLVPANASGRYEFSGSASANGKAYPVAGDRVIDGQDSLHPADTNADSAISQTELTAYAAAWKSGTTVARGPVPVPLTFVTRAGMLWRRGETYSFDVTQGPPPLCWVSRQPQPMVAIASTPSTSERTITRPHNPGSPFDVTITVTPGTLISAFALVEQLPRNWTVSNISGEGHYDPQAGSIRWGLNLGDTPGKFTYSILPPAAVASVCRITGSVSFDGTVQEIGGTDHVVVASSDTELTLPGVEKGSSGNITLQIAGPVGQVCVLEVSTDLVTWEQVDMVFLADGLLRFDQPAAQTQRYYRLRVE